MRKMKIPIFAKIQPIESVVRGMPVKFLLPFEKSNLISTEKEPASMRRFSVRKRKKSVMKMRFWRKGSIQVIVLRGREIKRYQVCWLRRI